MRPLARKRLLGALLSFGILESVAQNGYVVPAGSPGFYHGNSSASVTFDQYSLFLDNDRALFLSGEFHPYRLPSQALWKDVLQKYKAAGLNGVSVYWHWGLTSPRQGVNRWTNHNDIAKFLEVAKEVGLLVIARPGPYINAESSGGGLPAWLGNVPVLARTNATAFRDAWHPYITEFAKLAAPYQYPNGPLIGIQSENEFGTSEYYNTPGLEEYMQDVIDTLRAGGLNKIPTTHNDNWPKGAYGLPGLGQVDLYGWDGYPALFDCIHPDVWPETDTSLHANHVRLAPAIPLALYEWQGGAFDYWGGAGYEGCYKLTNEKFANVFYKNNIAGGAKLQNLYMTFGGTNWGNIATESVYSSYDYGAPIREDRTITPKLQEIKVQSYFLHASPAYLTADHVGDGNWQNGTSFSNSHDIYTTVWHENQSKTNFYIVRQITNTKTDVTEFKLRVNSTVLGQEVTVPSSGSLILDGRESKVLVTDYKFGSSNLIFSTAEVLTWETFDGVDYIYLYTNPSASVEIYVSSNRTSSNSSVPAGFSVNSTSTYTVVRAAANRPNTISAIPLGSVTLIVADKSVALQTWAPRTSVANNFARYNPVPGVPGVWILGPLLVRTASLNRGTLALEGDIDKASSIDIWGPSSISKVTWNGKNVRVSKNKQLQSLHGDLSMAVNSVNIPKLPDLTWKCQDNTPEANPDYDDSSWVVANKTSTPRPYQPIQGKYVLYGEEYGYYYGEWVWRGHFDGNATGLQLAVSTGFSGAMTAYLNGVPLGSAQGSSIGWSGVDVQEANFTFTASALRKRNNVVTVYHDSTGLSSDYNVNDEFKKPRGIRGYKLVSDNGNDFTKWTVAGNYGRENPPDTVRGHLNEGGWYYERVGAHLPGYDDSSWKKCSPYQGRNSTGITAYRTTFNLNIPDNADVPLAFEFELDESQQYRSVIWVNGWQYGRFSSDLGPQTVYPVPEGILNHQGRNEVLVTLWSLNGAAKMKKFELNKRAVLSSAKTSRIGLVQAPKWSDLRRSKAN
ncbi:putative beta-galactosidase [Serendipita vermifera]|nr:putative beta-galactosidase [Serendipita vermifera]